MSARRLALFGGRPAVEHRLPAYNTIGAAETEAALRVLRSGELSAFYGSAGDNFFGGPEIKRFEAAWAERFGARHAVAMNSATSALIAAVGALGLMPGDEMIVPPYTMIASATAAKVWGAVPVFADIRRDLFTLDPQAVEAAITPRTKAIMAVNLFGQPADLKALIALARPRGIRLIEDNAQAPGALYRNRQAGTVGDIGVFSLNCHKTIQTGEGGVACTHDAELALRLQLIRNHGEAVVRELGYARAPERLIGFNFRMGELEAAIGAEQLRRLDALTAPRLRLAALYDERLRHLPGLAVPRVEADRTHVYYVYALTLDEAAAGFSRRALVRALEAEGVPAFEGYCRPLYREPLFAGDAGNRAGLCPVTETLYERGLLFHTWLYEAVEPFAPMIATAFEKVWDNRAALVALDDDGRRAVRRR
jgi:dTDP-4-amino-4,6-dideoxygalactose transaminase